MENKRKETILIISPKNIVKLANQDIQSTKANAHSINKDLFQFPQSTKGVSIYSPKISPISEISKQGKLSVPKRRAIALSFQTVNDAQSNVSIQTCSKSSDELSNSNTKDSDTIKQNEFECTNTKGSSEGTECNQCFNSEIEQLRAKIKRHIMNKSKNTSLFADDTTSQVDKIMKNDALKIIFSKDYSRDDFKRKILSQKIDYEINSRRIKQAIRNRSNVRLFNRNIFGKQKHSTDHEPIQYHSILNTSNHDNYQSVFKYKRLSLDPIDAAYTSNNHIQNTSVLKARQMQKSELINEVGVSKRIQQL